MTDLRLLRNELLNVADQSGPYTAFDVEQDDFTNRAVRDFLSDLAVAFANLQEKSDDS